MSESMKILCTILLIVVVVAAIVISHFSSILWGISFFFAIFGVANIAGAIAAWIKSDTESGREIWKAIVNVFYTIDKYC